MGTLDGSRMALHREDNAMTMLFKARHPMRLAVADRHGRVVFSGPPEDFDRWSRMMKRYVKKGWFVERAPRVYAITSAGRNFLAGLEHKERVMGLTPVNPGQQAVKRQPHHALPPQLKELFDILHPYSDKELSERVGWHKNMFSMYRSGKTDPKFGTVVALAQLAGYDVVLRAREPRP